MAQINSNVIKISPTQKKGWVPDDDLSCGINWTENPIYPGMLFFEASQEEIIDVLVNKLGRNNPMEPSGTGDNCGQPEYFLSEGSPKIAGLLLAPHSAATTDNQSTFEYTIPERIAKIKREGEARLTKGLPFIKNPPIARLSPNSPSFGNESGNNRERTFWDKYGPEALQLFIRTEDPQNIHDNANKDMAILRARRNANPVEVNRPLTMKDHVFAIQKEFATDPYITETISGKRINPEKIPLHELDKDHPVWIAAFELICGDWVTNPSKRTEIFNMAVGRHLDREFDVPDEQIFRDLTENGWADGTIKDKEGKTTFKLVDWKEHIDRKRQSIIIVRALNVQSHRNDAIYNYIQEYREDKDFAKFLKDENILYVDIYAKVNHKTKALTDSARDELEASLYKANRHILEMREVHYPDMPLFRFVMFPKQYKSEKQRTVNLLQSREKKTKTK